MEEEIRGANLGCRGRFGAQTSGEMWGCGVSPCLRKPGSAAWQDLAPTQAPVSLISDNSRRVSAAAARPRRRRTHRSRFSFSLLPAEVGKNPPKKKRKKKSCPPGVWPALVGTHARVGGELGGP